MDTKSGFLLLKVHAIDYKSHKKFSSQYFYILLTYYCDYKCVYGFLNDFLCRHCCAIYRVFREPNNEQRLKTCVVLVMQRKPWLVVIPSPCIQENGIKLSWNVILYCSQHLIRLSILCMFLSFRDHFNLGSSKCPV